MHGIEGAGSRAAQISGNIKLGYVRRDGECGTGTGRSGMHIGREEPDSAVRRIRNKESQR